jgi:putative transposase
VRGGMPRVIPCDQDTEFTAIALHQWACWNKVPLDFSRRGKPGDNAVCVRPSTGAFDVSVFRKPTR